MEFVVGVLKHFGNMFFAFVHWILYLLYNDKRFSFELLAVRVAVSYWLYSDRKLMVIKIQEVYGTGTLLWPLAFRHHLGTHQKRRGYIWNAMVNGNHIKYDKNI